MLLAYETQIERLKSYSMTRSDVFHDTCLGPVRTLTQSSLKHNDSLI